LKISTGRRNVVENSFKNIKSLKLKDNLGRVKPNKIPNL
jgi:hypothetical protein